MDWPILIGVGVSILFTAWVLFLPIKWARGKMAPRDARKNLIGAVLFILAIILGSWFFGR